MINIVNLIRGELQRLYKYKIFVFGIVVSLIWVLIIWVSNKEDIEALIPMLIMVDAALMNIILLAAAFFLEKQEGTIKSVLVSPICLVDVLISKIVAAMVVSLISTTMVIAVSMIVHNIEINLLLLFIYVIIIVFAHTAIGFLITLYSKEFGSVLGYYFIYAIVSFFPSLLFTIGVIAESFEKILILSPSHASQILLNHSFSSGDTWSIILSVIYLIGLGVVLYRGIIYKRFKDYAIGG